MTEDHTLGQPNFVFHALVRSPVGPGRPKPEEFEFSTLIPPEKIESMRTWKDTARVCALAFYRALSGDKRGEELVKAFEGSISTEQKRHDLRERLGILAGQASMCWDKDDVFDSHEASGAVDDAFDRIMEILNREPFL